MNTLPADKVLAIAAAVSKAESFSDLPLWMRKVIISAEEEAETRDELERKAGLRI